ncbi:MAG: hypothetical protein D6806_10550 [Deltaproteobacteria bacterium]|nr:MAG: hypothetical protein D6806_10550 [Deltaproteobacteria bacterium]
MHFFPAAVFSCVLLSAAYGAGSFSARLRVQFGEEYDSNSGRVNQPVVADGLHRMLLDLESRWSPAEGHRIDFDAMAGGKVFYSQHDENLMASSVHARWSMVLSRHLDIAVSAGWQETFLAVHDRDYRLVDARMGLVWRSNAATVVGWFGGRWFHFKPDDFADYRLKLSNAGPSAGVELRIAASSISQVYFHYVYGLSLYGDRALYLDGRTPVDSASNRLDHLHRGGIGVRYRAKLAASVHMVLNVGFSASLVDSNSYGSSAIRQRVHAMLGLALPAGLRLQLAGSLQFAEYQDGIYLEGDFYQPEADENENALVARVLVPLWRELDLVVQAGWYRNDFQATEPKIDNFERITVMGGLSWTAEF